MTDYPDLYKRLARAVVAVDGRIGADTSAFIAGFVDKLRRQGYALDGAAEAALNSYVDAMNAAIKTAITQSVAIGSGLEVGAASMQSKAMLAATEQAFVTRWPDGLTLSDRLWRWKQSARDGVQAQLQAGIKQSKATGSIVYDMQRAIESDAGYRFRVVSASKDDWVKKLHISAQGMIHDGHDKVEWQKIVGEAEGRISEMSRTGNRNAAERLLSQIKKGVEKGQEALLDNAVKWWTYDQQLYHLKRIARTEMATAAHRAVIDSTIGDETIIGYQWRLSASHPATDICDYYAGIEMGLGKGVWTKEAVPRHKAHPHCMCLLIPRVTPIKQKGDKNYADFINNTSPERRAQLLPRWAREATDSGVPLEKLLRPDGLGLQTRQHAEGLLNHAVVEKIVAKLVEKANNAASVDALWTSPASLERHIKQRTAYGHITDADDYRLKITHALKTATHFSLATGNRFPLVEFRSNDWSVILNHDGEIKTAYRLEPDEPSFSDNQKRLKYKVHDYDVNPGIKQSFGRLFSPR